jgi:hypothetical protein
LPAGSFKKFRSNLEVFVFMTAFAPSCRTSCHAFEFCAPVAYGSGLLRKRKF